VEPREDNAVHEAPGARWRSVVVDEDVIVEDESPQCEEDLSSPTGVVGRRRIQHRGQEGPDVVQSYGLSVEGSDEVGVEVRGEGVVQGFLKGGRRAAEEALCGDHLGGQSGAQGTLPLQGEGGGALALPRGRHCGLDHSEGVDERGVGGGECRGRYGVAPGGCGEGGKARRGASTLGQRGRDGERPEADDVGGPSMGELAAERSRGDGEVRARAGGGSGDVVHGGHRGDGWRKSQQGASGRGGALLRRQETGRARPGGAQSGRGGALLRRLETGRAWPGWAQPCFGGRRRVAVGPGGGSRRGWDRRPGGGSQDAEARQARSAGCRRLAGGGGRGAGGGRPAAGKEAGRLGAGG
jgi:hypothetical protein